jgi:hypothetical protein
MQNVPHIVRERLKAAPAVVRPGADSSAHPDADLLTAFAERSLAEFERTAVLEHLSRCGDCRDVVALALPASEEMAMTGVRTSPRGWLSWPALRWGFVAAGVVAIASVGILRYQRRPATAALQKSVRLEVAANEPKKQDLDRFVTPETRTKEKLPAPAAPVPTDSVSGSNSARADSAIADSAVDAKKSVSQPEGSAVRGPTPQTKSGTNSFHGGAFAANALPHGPKVANQANQWQQQNTFQNNTQNSARSVPPPSAYPAANPAQAASDQAAANTQAPTASETVEVSSAAPVIDTETRNLGSDQGRDQSTVDRAKAPVPSGASVPSTRAASGAGGAMITQPYSGGAVAGPLDKTGPGKMFGYVFDPSGAVVPNVRITVTPSNSGGTAAAVTDSQGAWLIAGLPTGNYQAQAEAPGFRTTVVALNYDANQPSPYRFTLDLGSAAETVEVTGGNAQVETESANIESPVNGRNSTQLSTLTPAAMPRWTISATGGLQRSLDQGKTWQAVDVNAKLAPLAYADSSATNSQITAETSSAKVAKDKNSGKLAKQKTTAPTFRAVAAAGSDVWVGGSGGALYHSADSGNSWARIVPASAGTSLTGDVLSIDFPDPQHGRVSTSTSEVWASADGGLSWQKQ